MTLPQTFGPRDLATDAETVRAYAELTADLNPIHLDPAFAATTPFGRPIAHGTMALALLLEALAAAGLRARDLDIRFVRPVPVGATIRAGGRLADPAAGSYNVSVETVDGTRVLEGRLSAAADP